MTSSSTREDVGEVTNDNGDLATAFARVDSTAERPTVRLRPANRMMAASFFSWGGGTEGKAMQCSSP